MNKRYPFEVVSGKPFVEQVGEWVADVFYDILPESGFEVRDEQIFMAYQVERAYADKKTIFAEAGVGTGKTLVYLLYAVCYARYTGKPAVVACADESLIEQLAKPEGDLAKLAKHLNLTVDARLGKSQDRYLCLQKLDDARLGYEDTELYKDIYESLPPFVGKTEALQSFHAYGDRKEYPDLDDVQWGRIGWDSFRDCFVCDKRHRCGMTLSREHYRKATDVVICSHDFYMEHVWTYESRKREGQLPLLPEHSSIVFDEGHLLEAAAQKALTYRLKHAAFEELVTRVLKNDIRESLAVQIDLAIERSELLFEALAARSVKVAGSDRMEIKADKTLLKSVAQLDAVLERIEENLVFESELFNLDGYQLRIVEEHLEMMRVALGLFAGPKPPICWTVDGLSGLTLVIMPRTVREVLGERVFDKPMPIVFSSATLSSGESFDYLAHSLGVTNYLSFTVASPYDYPERMKVTVPRAHSASIIEDKQGLTAWKAENALAAIGRAKGGVLILFLTKEALASFKSACERKGEMPGRRLLFEGDREITVLISEFQRDLNSVLCAVTLWEGLDIPGPSLATVIMWSLPYPPDDPVFDAKRREAADAYREVDLPYMLLRFKQGLGRLIRTREDSGEIVVLAPSLAAGDFPEAEIRASLPAGVDLTIA
ncbi:ATP-dependent DNA helicase [Cohnella hashimotonis]|uniref:ATP-dependent DNA helicase n=1 Tax=Cohnella hashimotonis TaxID=2826895 RepID=A0ABT6TIB5_9BACL|nr:ATP-dependent DNA helicase [Cohnella hashimotonis]MDI4646043.1 ATP-dependent DNA helicase [Cohnella hashimotonis]